MMNMGMGGNTFMFNLVRITYSYYTIINFRYSTAPVTVKA